MRAFAERWRLSLLLLLFLMAAAPEASENYRSVQTDHFRLHYPQKLRPYAERMGQIAEAVHDTLARRYGIDLQRPTEMVVENSLLASGYANPSTDRIAISATDWGFLLRSQHDWLRNVVTHEYSHILSLARGAKVPGWLFGVVIGYADYHGEAVQQNGAVAVPFRSIPVWFSEGTAQYETERMGFDLWDAHRDMILRRAVVDTSLFTLSQMGQFAELREIDLERAPYTQGYALVRYIAQRWGDDAVVAIWRESARWSGFDAAVQKVTGLTTATLYKEWKGEMERHYTAQLDSLGTPFEGVALTKGSWLQDRPRYDSHGRLYFLSNLGGDSWNSVLVRLPADTTGLEPALRPDSNGLWPLSPWRIKEGFRPQRDLMERGYAPWSSLDSNHRTRIAYVTYRNRDRHRERRLDIVSQDSASHSRFRAPQERRLTHLADAIDPDYRSDGRALLYVARDKESARFSLWKIALDSLGGRTSEPQQLLSDSSGSIWNFGLYTPRWSPSGAAIAYSWFDGNNRRVSVIDTAGKRIADLATGGSDERDPVWDGDSSLIISSNRGGIFNLWKVPLNGAPPQQLTRMVGGAFSPDLSPDRKTVAFIGYDKSGFSLRRLSLDTTLPMGGMLTTPERRSPLALDGFERQFAGIERPYHPLPSRMTALPIVMVEEYAGDLRGLGDGHRALKAGFNLSIDDPLQHNQISLVAMLELTGGFDFIKNGKTNPRQQKDLYLVWENRSLPIAFQTSALYRNLHAKDTLVSEDKGHPTSVVPIAIRFLAAEERLSRRGLSLNDSISVWGGWESGRFNLYEDRFAWDFYRAWRTGIGWGWGSTSHRLSQREPLLQPSGFAAMGVAEHRWAGLFRTGKFFESFVMDESGAMPRARLRDWQIVDLGALLYGGIGWRWGVTSLQATWQGVPHWSADHPPGDSLDLFFNPTVHVAGYPSLIAEDEPLLQGVQVAHLELRHTIPLWESQFTWKSFSHRGSSLSIVAEAGRAAPHWGGFLKTEHGDWLRGWGVEWRFSQRLFYGIPLEVWLGAAQAIDRTPLGDRVEPLGPKGINRRFLPTSVELGVALQFWNPGMGHHPKNKMNIYPHSY